MFERPHHNRILKALHFFNADLLERTSACFAGGTAIVLLCNEYRESVDIDFICSDLAGYQHLRQSITDRTLGNLVTAPVDLINLSADADGIRCFLMIDGVPIKFEILHEDRIQIEKAAENPFPVPLLSMQDMYAEKLLANTDRGLDTSTLSRDMIDLAMMMMKWGDIPLAALAKAGSARAYGMAIHRHFLGALKLMEQRDQAHLIKSLDSMQMDDKLRPRILEALHASLLYRTKNPASLLH